jgi:hypothetical protein
MPAHYVYREPNKATLNQGDVLQKTPALVAHLDQYHKYYANHVDYKYFMVLTQTCDLVRRDGVCGSPYITIAAVRPVEEVLRREAAKSQAPWQREAGVIGAKAAEKLVMFLTSLFDNNQDGYFYLHQDVGLGIHQNCCAFLPLSVALKIDHYNLCLEAKIAELTDTFQAKLGSLIGQLYSRVAAPEWNEHYPDNAAGTEAAKLLGRTFVKIDDRRMAEGVADLRRAGTFDTMRPADIMNHITKFRITPKRELFQKRAVDVISAEGNNLIDLLRARMQKPLKTDPELLSGIDNLLAEAGVPEAARESLRGEIIHKFMERLREHFTDAKMPDDKRAVIEKVFAQLMQDATIRTILSDR